jgi:signal transduction histidine kinase
MPEHFPTRSSIEHAQWFVNELKKAHPSVVAWADIWTHDPVSNQLVFLTAIETTEDFVVDRVLSCEKVLGGQVVETRSPNWFPDLTQTYGGRRFSQPGLIRQMGLTGMYSVPVLNSCNHHQVLLVVNVFHGGQAAQVPGATSFFEHWKALQEEVEAFGHCYERCLEQECTRAVNRLNATLDSRHPGHQKRTVRSASQMFVNVVRARIGCDFVALFNARSQDENLLPQAFTSGIHEVLPYIKYIEHFAVGPWRENREKFRQPIPAQAGTQSARPGKFTCLGVPIRGRSGSALGTVVLLNHTTTQTQPYPQPFRYEQVAVVEALAQSFVPRLELLFAEEERLKKMSRLAHEMRVPISAFGAALEVVEAEVIQKNWRFRYDYLGDLKSYLRILSWNVRELDVVRGAECRIQLMTDAPCFLQSEIIEPARHHVEPECKRRKFDVRKIRVGSFLNRIPKLYVDRELMTQVVFNLLENAIKYSHNDPDLFSVRIEPYVTPAGFEIHFQDNGVGVPAGSEERIFEDGYRHPSIHEIPGDGWGLYVARRLVAVHGGSIYCRKAARGSLFVIQLPKLLEERGPQSNDIRR